MSIETTSTSERVVALEAIIAEQVEQIDMLIGFAAEIDKKYKREIEMKKEAREDWIAEHKINLKWLRMCEFVIRELALDCVLDRTHRERNEFYRSLIKTLIMTRVNIEKLVMPDDDVPF